MRASSILSIAFLTLGVEAARVLVSNDDGWAEANIRTFFNVLTASGHNVVLSAPAENQSGTGSDDAPPATVTNGCEFNSCPAGSPPTGSNSSNTRLNYVNSYPVTSVKYGLNTSAPRFFGSSPPDIVVTGPNVGSNEGSTVDISGTVGAAVEAAHNHAIPAIAFSGSTGSQVSYTTTTGNPPYDQIYADLALNVTNHILASGTPYLPADTWLNVNFPSTSKCTNVNQFKFVYSRIFAITSESYPESCGESQPPTESSVTATSGCYASISVGDASDKTDAKVAVQTAVYKKLQGLVTCLP